MGKDRTKELKPIVRDILDKHVWHGNNHMIDYSMGEIAQLVQLDNGYIVSVEKQKIEKDFCFGYSDSPYNTEDYDRANEMARYARTSEEYFISQNMKEFDKTIKMIDESKKDYDSVVEWNRQLLFLTTPYIGQPDDSIYKSRINACRVSTFLDAMGGSANLEEVKGTTVKTKCFACPLSEGINLYILSDKDIDDIREAYVRARNSHEKKVKNYLKRYGMSKVNTWSYWRDE